MKYRTVDVLIIGAGLSGIGAAVHLQKECPGKSYEILESRKSMGGTWDLFRYPGIRSDSDMFTLGYTFKPWKDNKSIADGPSILKYINETAKEYGVEKNINYEKKVVALDWSSREAIWTVKVKDAASDEIEIIKCNFVFSCTGYYRYEQGHTPEFKGSERFRGKVIHPQRWPENLNYRGKRVVVIGSGATAVTLVPAMCDKAEHVAMLQRSPSYVVSVPARDAMSMRLKEYFSDRWVYKIIRARNILAGVLSYKFFRRFPIRSRKFLIDQIKSMMGADFEVSHFTPKYNPWDERLCAVPDGDMFKEIKNGNASVVTDKIECFTETGVRLASGEELPADIIVTATGLEVEFMSGIEISLDAQPVDISKKMYYRGAMLEDIPNLSMIFGYTSLAWTLKADLINKYTCRVINYMDQHGYKQVTPRSNFQAQEKVGFLSDLKAGYITRALETMPRHGNSHPWKVYQDYFSDFIFMRYGRINDKVLVYSKPTSHIYDFGLESKPELKKYVTTKTTA